MATTTGKTKPIDVHIGLRIRAKRLEHGLSLGEIAKKFEITFQQFQKYEKGANRIGAGLLQEVARVLETPIAWFYEGAPSTDSSARKIVDDITAKFFALPHAAELARDFIDIAYGDDRVTVAQVARTIANASRIANIKKRAA